MPEHSLSGRRIYRKSDDLGRCNSSPRYVTGRTDSEVKSDKCHRSDFNITANDNTFTMHYHVDLYPTICTLASQECANAVCHLQGMTPDDKSGWSCHSDPVIAQAAADGTYWFANGSVCATKPQCKNVKSPLNLDYPSDGPRLSVLPIIALALFGVGLVV